MRDSLRARRDSNPQPADLSFGLICRHWWIRFLDWFISEVEAAPSASVVGIDTITRAKCGLPEGGHLEVAPEPTRLATVTPLWGSHDAARKQ